MAIFQLKYVIFLFEDFASIQRTFTRHYWRCASLCDLYASIRFTFPDNRDIYLTLWVQDRLCDIAPSGEVIFVRARRSFQMPEHLLIEALLVIGDGHLINRIDVFGRDNAGFLNITE